MIVHFICRGNTYRSRLAETYLNSKEFPDIKATSSGIEADNNISGSISWYAQRIIWNERLIKYEKMVWDKTTKELLDGADLIIFLKDDIYNFCVSHLGFKGETKFEVWDIPDLVEEGQNEAQKMKTTEETFLKIKEKVDELILKLSNK